MLAGCHYYLRAEVRSFNRSVDPAISLARKVPDCTRSSMYVCVPNGPIWKVRAPLLVE